MLLGDLGAVAKGVGDDRRGHLQDQFAQRSVAGAEQMNPAIAEFLHQVVGVQRPSGPITRKQPGGALVARRHHVRPGVQVALCAAQVPGDTYRNLRISPDYSRRTFKHVLVPVWVLSYNYGARAFQVIVNGYTGRIAGKYPYSVWKIVLLVILALIALGVFIVLQGE